MEGFLMDFSSAWRTLRRTVVVVLMFGGLRASLPGVELPQDHAWQRVLRTYLDSLKPADFAIVNTDWQFVDNYKTTDHERLYRDWIALKSGSRLPASVQFYAAPEWFTLEGIERSDGIYTFPNPAGMTWWTQFDVPGNPFCANRAARTVPRDVARWSWPSST
jgi:hypothetical protein